MSSVSTDTITLTGAEIIVKTLKKLGVDTIFGYPGGIVLSIYDELFKQHDIKHYLVRHEQSAVHAAEGYARVSGKCGVVLVTSGPGAANTVSGIAAVKVPCKIHILFMKRRCIAHQVRLFNVYGILEKFRSICNIFQDP